MPAIEWTGDNGAFRLSIETDGRARIVEPPDGEPPSTDEARLPFEAFEMLIAALRTHQVCTLSAPARPPAEDEREQTLALALPGLTCTVRMLRDDWIRDARAKACADALERFLRLFRAQVEAQRPGPLQLGDAQLDGLSKETAAGLQRALRDSGTAHRLARAGLHLSSAEVALPARDVHALAAFRTEGEAGLVADVYCFDDWETLAKARTLEQPPSPGDVVRVSQNGAFAVRIIAPGEDAQDRVLDVASAIAGEE